ncbi:MAG: AraC family transcriptional regulator [Verrucomicrobiota bacterium]
MNTRTASPLSQHIVLHTRNLTEGQDVTSHIWSKHESRVIGRGGYESCISRMPLGRSWLCHVDCRSPMHVLAEGSKTKVTVYLPLAGSMKISVVKQKLSAVQGGPALIPAATPIEFHATPIRCILLEIPSSKLQGDLSALGCDGKNILPTAWEPGSHEAEKITTTLEFVMDYLSREDRDDIPPMLLRRLESLVIGCLAEALAARTGTRQPTGQKIGRISIEDMRQKVADCLHSNCNNEELAAYAGVTTRTLQQQFLKYFHTTPTAYVQEQRLAAARNELRDPVNKKTVTRIASDLEFHHLGRFSTAYRRKFGESPSQTHPDSGERTLQRTDKK